MRILVTGASGLIGSALIPSLEARGFGVVRLSRKRASVSPHIVWDLTKALPPETVSGFDAVIHLAGEPVASRWTKEKKKRISDSRVLGTSHLSTAIAQAAKPPRVFISASAVGYYGDRGDEILHENSSSGQGFLAETCRQWEAATASAEEAGIRVVQVRMGIVLSTFGGALKAMLPAFRIGLGAQMGGGRQWMSWIHIEDLVGAMHHVIDHPSLIGPTNLVAPEPVRNSEFTHTLANVLRRPAALRMPALAARLIFGDMANGVLLAGQRVEPRKLLATGYRFRFPNLRGALENLLRSPEKEPRQPPQWTD